MREAAEKRLERPALVRHGTVDAAAPRLSVIRKLRLAIEILRAYAGVRWALRRDDLPRVVTRLRAPRSSQRPPAVSTLDGRRLGAAVVRLLEALPVDSRCLMRSLVLLRLLARRGIGASLVIAVRPDGDLALSAHAWLESDDGPLLAVASPGHARLVTL